MTAIETLKHLNQNGVFFPWRRKDKGIFGQPSNSDLFRWLTEGAVAINGATPGPKDAVEWPIHQLVFFPNGKNRTTLQ